MFNCICYILPPCRRHSGIQWSIYAIFRQFLKYKLGARYGFENLNNRYTMTPFFGGALGEKCVCMGSISQWFSNFGTQMVC